MLSRTTPQTTIDAIVQAIREGGAAALLAPDNQDRLGMCDNTARQKIAGRLAKLCPGEVFDLQAPLAGDDGEPFDDGAPPPTGPEDYGLPNGEVEQLASAENASVFALPPLTIDEWLARQLDPPDRLMGAWLTTTSRVLIDGPTGLGKTLFVMQIVMNAAAGINFVHWRAHRPCRVLYIDGEMARRLLRERIKGALARIGEAIPPVGFHILSREDLEDMPPLNTPEGQTVIERIIAAIGGVDLIVFDSIMCLLAGDPKETAPWASVMPWVRHHTKQKRGQIWVHHTGHDITRGYGDKAKEWQLDTVAHMTQAENPLTDVCFTLNFTKAREREPLTRADFATAKYTLVNDTWQSDAAVPGSKGRVSPLGLKFLDALNDALAGEERPAMITGRRSTALTNWRAECVRRGLIDPESKPDSARNLFNKHRRELIAANFIACNLEAAWTL